MDRGESAEALKAHAASEHRVESSQAFLNGEAPEITEADRMAHHARVWPRANA